MGELIRVAKKKDVPVGGAITVDVKGKTVALFNVNNQYYAIDDECTHAGGNLSEGPVDGTVVTCPWHAATFDITTGKVLSDPAAEDVNSYKVHVEGEEIKIELA